MEMAPTLIEVAVTPGEFAEGVELALDVDGAVLVAPLVVVVVLDEDEQPANKTATPSASAPGISQLPRSFPMTTLP